MAQDELVTSAIAHWGPRFTVNGVTVSDFERVTARVEAWDDWCSSWVAAGPEGRGRAAQRRDSRRHAGGRPASAGHR